MSGVSNFSPFVNVNTFKKIYKNTFTVNFSWSQCEISAGGGNSTAEYCIIICKGQIKIPLPLINIHRNNDQKPIRKQWALNFREKCELLEKTAEVGIHFSVLDALLILALV